MIQPQLVKITHELLNENSLIHQAKASKLFSTAISRGRRNVHAKSFARVSKNEALWNSNRRDSNLLLQRFAALAHQLQPPSLHQRRQSLLHENFDHEQ